MASNDAELIQVKKKLEEANGTIESQKKSIAELKEDLVIINDLYVKAEKASKDAEAALEGEKKKVKTLEQDVQEMKENEAMKEKKRLLEESKRELKESRSVSGAGNANEMKKLSEEAQDLQEKLKQAKIQLLEKEKQINEIVNTVGTNVRELDKLRNTNSQLEKQKKEADTKAKELETKLKDSDAKLKESDRKQKELEAKLKDLESRLAKSKEGEGQKSAEKRPEEASPKKGDSANVEDIDAVRKKLAVTERQLRDAERELKKMREEVGLGGFSNSLTVSNLPSASVFNKVTARSTTTISRDAKPGLKELDLKKKSMQVSAMNPRIQDIIDSATEAGAPKLLRSGSELSIRSSLKNSSVTKNIANYFESQMKFEYQHKMNQLKSNFEKLYFSTRNCMREKELENFAIEDQLKMLQNEFDQYKIKVLENESNLKLELERLNKELNLTEKLSKEIEPTADKVQKEDISNYKKELEETIAKYQKLEQEKSSHITHLKEKMKIRQSLFGGGIPEMNAEDSEESRRKKIMEAIEEKEIKNKGVDEEEFENLKEDLEKKREKYRTLKKQKEELIENARKEFEKEKEKIKEENAKALNALQKERDARRQELDAALKEKASQKEALENLQKDKERLVNKVQELQKSLNKYAGQEQVIKEHGELKVRVEELQRQRESEFTHMKAAVTKREKDFQAYFEKYNEEAKKKFSEQRVEIERLQNEKRLLIIQLENYKETAGPRSSLDSDKRSILQRTRNSIFVDERSKLIRKIPHFLILKCQPEFKSSYLRIENKNKIRIAESSKNSFMFKTSDNQNMLSGIKYNFTEIFSNLKIFEQKMKNYFLVPCKDTCLFLLGAKSTNKKQIQLFFLEKIINAMEFYIIQNKSSTFSYQFSVYHDQIVYQTDSTIGATGKGFPQNFYCEFTNEKLQQGIQEMESIYYKIKQQFVTKNEKSSESKIRMLKAGLVIKTTATTFKENNFLIISNNYINPIAKQSLSDRELIEDVLLNSKVKSHKQRGFEDLGVTADLLIDFDKLVFLTINPTAPMYKQSSATLSLSSAFFLRGAGGAEKAGEAAKQKASGAYESPVAQKYPKNNNSKANAARCLTEPSDPANRRLETCEKRKFSPQRTGSEDIDEQHREMLTQRIHILESKNKKVSKKLRGILVILRQMSQDSERKTNTSRRMLVAKRFDKFEQEIKMLVDDIEYSNFIKSYKAFIKKNKITDLQRYLEDMKKKKDSQTALAADGGDDSESDIDQDEPEHEESKEGKGRFEAEGSEAL